MVWLSTLIQATRDSDGPGHSRTIRLPGTTLRQRGYQSVKGERLGKPRPEVEGICNRGVAAWARTPEPADAAPRQSDGRDLLRYCAIKAPERH